MLEINKTKITCEVNLRKKVDYAGSFTNQKITLENGALIRLIPTNIAYVEPHKVIINQTTFLFFNHNNKFYINDLSNEYELKDLSKYFKLAKEC